jgi:uncharacterized membrane protein YoaK (UPF0700 family)
MTDKSHPCLGKGTAQPTNDPPQSICLAFLAGYVDTLGFIALFGVFTAHVTGNFILIGRELAHPTQGVLIRLLAFPAFIVSVAGTRLLILFLQRHEKCVLFYIYIVQFFLLAGFAVSGYLAGPAITPDMPWALLASVLGAAAMAMQNASAKLLLSHIPPSTIMTGNVTQLVINFVDFARGAASEKEVHALRGLLWTVAAFACGAIGAGFGYGAFGFVALVLPCLMLLWLAWHARQQDSSSPP